MSSWNGPYCHKWRRDGTSGQAEYKQLFQGGSGKTIVWGNHTACFPRSWRPLKFIFAKVTTNLIKYQVDCTHTPLELLTPSQLQFTSNKIFLNHHLSLCMIDGKTVNANTETKSINDAICVVWCQKTSISHYLFKRVVNSPYLNYGISPLYARIRLFECLIHVTYHLNITKRQIWNTDDKTKMEINKKTAIISLENWTFSGFVQTSSWYYKRWK